MLGTNNRGSCKYFLAEVLLLEEVANIRSMPMSCLLQCLVIPTDEELSIAQQTLEVVRGAGKGAARV